MATPTDPFTIGHLRRLENFLQLGKRQKSFWTAPMGEEKKVFFPISRESRLRNSERLSASQEAKHCCIYTSREMSGGSVLSPQGNTTRPVIRAIKPLQTGLWNGHKTKSSLVSQLFLWSLLSSFLYVLPKRMPSCGDAKAARTLTH